MTNKGDWFLTYESFDNMENQLSLAHSVQRVALNAPDEETATDLAVERWDTMTKLYSYRGWDGVTYPCNPKLEYSYSKLLKRND